ncbi:MAG: Na+/H+ antiporter subunit E [Spirochaetes bacterium]|nr:Na+/H+ antiporter subunit E [Spirochaetota bacterium]
MRVRSKWKLVRILFTTIWLYGGWLLYTGSFEAISLSLGAIASLFVAIITYDLFIAEYEAARKGLLVRIHYGILYLLYLLAQMYLSSFAVLINILRGNINPRVVHFRTRLHSDLARVLLATSITLTPGTIALELQEDHLIVHWLDAKTLHSKYAGILIKGKMETLLSRVLL